MCSEISTPPACYSMVLSLLPPTAWTNRWVNEGMSSHLGIRIDWIFTLPPALGSVVIQGPSLASQVVIYKAPFWLWPSCICISPKLEHLVRPLSYNHSLACHTPVKVTIIQSHGAHQTTPFIYSMVCPPDICPAKHPQTGFTTWDTLLTSQLSTCMVLADPENKTDTPLQLHDRLLDWSGPSCTAAWCCPVRSMTAVLLSQLF